MRDGLGAAGWPQHNAARVAVRIHVTAIAPGSFRTEGAGRSMVRTERSISEYDALMNPIRERRQVCQR